MFERIQKLLDRIESRLSLWWILSTSGIFSSGLISAWIASATDWLNAYGPIAWWGAALIGALVSLSIVFVAARIRQAWINASAVKKWKEKVDHFNPLDLQFNKLRMNVLDVAHPVSKLIKHKQFIDCELMGPGNLHFSNNVRMTGVTFEQVDIIVARPGGQMHKANAISFDNVEVINGSIWNCTIIIPPALVQTFHSMGATFVTLTGDPQIDSP